ncbi:hypothetical protein HYFRA_00009231 [Hymenoscyphus fraxineus]|uniref:Uncharacterized protein n=1 Tax=Hymenoscyphus fraxineus TaxID=746836 RepID=A0A9N9PU37_9HELO|nr:hypothetical protein HYFRA_00009231 [Hymenoscyphus fraxineus]
MMVSSLDLFGFVLQPSLAAPIVKHLYEIPPASRQLIVSAPNAVEKSVGVLFSDIHQLKNYRARNSVQSFFHPLELTQFREQSTTSIKCCVTKSAQYSLYRSTLSLSRLPLYGAICSTPSFTSYNQLGMPVAPSHQVLILFWGPYPA